MDIRPENGVWSEAEHPRNQKQFLLPCNIMLLLIALEKAIKGMTVESRKTNRELSEEGN
jgi:hypothetical protein